MTVVMDTTDPRHESVFGGRSVAELGDLGIDAAESAGERHVHEFGLGVHLQTAHDGLVDLVVNRKLLAFVLGVGLEGSNHLGLLVAREGLSRDDRDLFLLVFGLVQLDVLVSNLADEVQALVVGKNGQEVERGVAEGGSLLEGHVQLSNFFAANATVLGEEAEGLTVLVDFLQVAHIFVHGVKGILLGSGREKNAGVATLDGVLLLRGLVVSG